MRQHPRICVGFALSAFAAIASAGTITVNDAGDAGPGDCASTCTLRDAIASAATDDTINFALATPATITLNGQELLIYKSLNIAGPGPGQLTISGNNQSRVFEIANKATVSIEGVAITGGLIVGIPGANDSGGNVLPGNGGGAQGGAIYVGTGSDLSLADCDIHDNAAIGGSGGGEFSPNNAISGGNGGPAEGGAVYAAGDVGASHCTFRANSANGGAGGDNQAIVPGVGGTTSGGAGSDGHGGALSIADGGSVELIDVTLAGNNANGGHGGNLFFPFPGSLGGAGGNASGGALSIAGFSFFEFVTSAGNSAVPGSGGFGMTAGSAGSATANDLLLGTTLVSRSSVFGSATPACVLVAGGIQAQGNNLDSDGSCPNFSLHGDPKLAPFAPNVGGRYVMFPQSGSPLIDAALDCQDAFGKTVTDDELGTSRPQGPKCDLGAVEADYIFVDGFGG